MHRLSHFIEQQHGRLCFDPILQIEAQRMERRWLAPRMTIWHFGRLDPEESFSDLNALPRPPSPHPPARVPPNGTRRARASSRNLDLSRTSLFSSRPPLTSPQKSQHERGGREKAVRVVRGLGCPNKPREPQVLTAEERCLVFVPLVRAGQGRVVAPGRRGRRPRFYTFRRPVQG